MFFFVCEKESFVVKHICISEVSLLFSSVTLGEYKNLSRVVGKMDKTLVEISVLCG